jgi:hypothetical protein
MYEGTTVSIVHVAGTGWRARMGGNGIPYHLNRLVEFSIACAKNDDLFRSSPAAAMGRVRPCCPAGECALAITLPGGDFSSGLET